MNSLQINLQVPDLWQNEALRSLRAGKDVVVDAPTGEGKTYIFELLIEAGFNRKAVFTVPTRALSNDKLNEWRSRNWNVGIATGDISENLDAPVVVATLETQKARFLRRKGPGLFVIDEYQMLGDPIRGTSYELALALLPPETQLLLLSGSVGNPDKVREWLCRIGRDAVLVQHKKRAVPQEEVFLDALPGRPPARITGFWPRLVARALMADLGPILVFAPQRTAAETLARRFAAAYPVDEPLVLSGEQRKLAGEKLSRMLKNRVAFHHSGLSYRQRAGLIEPLAKAGQLRIVVATTGLAAGINFSMRSVLVTDREYRHGFVHEEVRPDELLQMFGRAGRRGLDEVGYVLVAPGRPRLFDARPLHLQRAMRVDWPSLMGVMQGGVERGKFPFQEAVNACARLFSEGKVFLGVEHSLETGRRECGMFVDGERARFVQPERDLVSGLDGQWSPKGPEGERPLRDLYVHQDGKWKAALGLPWFVGRFGEGNVCRLRSGRRGKGKVYGREIPVAVRESNGNLRLVRSVRKRLRQHGTAPTGGRVSESDFQEKIAPLVPGLFGGGKLYDRVERNRLLSVRIDYSDVCFPCAIDNRGNGLIDPPEKKEHPEECLRCDQMEICRDRLSRATSPALAWRKLGLVDKAGVPTRRGIVFGFFFHGEGLAITAALEDERYPVDDLVYDLANLRAGHRFAELDFAKVSRLRTACREAYPEEDFPGYLVGGAPTDYGDGASEAIRLMHLRSPGGNNRWTPAEALPAGDIERVYVEWRSILRQVCLAPDIEWNRWRELKEQAAKILNLNPAVEWNANFPPLEPSQKRRCNHVLRPFR